MTGLVFESGKVVIWSTSRSRCLGCGGSHLAPGPDGVCPDCGGPLLSIHLLGEPGEAVLPAVGAARPRPRKVATEPKRAPVPEVVPEPDCECGHERLAHFGPAGGPYGTCLGAHPVHQGSVCSCSSYRAVGA